MDIGSWVNAARLHARLTQAQLGERLGVTKGNISAWENGRHEPSFGNLRKIAEITGYAEPLPGIRSQQSAVSSPPGTRPIPRLRHAQVPIFASNATFFLGDIEETVTDLPVSAGSFALTIEDDSMQAPASMPGDTYSPGDVVIVDSGRRPRPGDFVVALVNTKAAVRKYRVLKAGDEDATEVFELLPLNPDYPSVRSDEAHIKLMGQVVEHRKIYT